MSHASSTFENTVILFQMWEKLLKVANFAFLQLCFYKMPNLINILQNIKNT